MDEYLLYRLVSEVVLEMVEGEYVSPPTGAPSFNNLGTYTHTKHANNNGRQTQWKEKMNTMFCSYTTPKGS